MTRDRALRRSLLATALVLTSTPAARGASLQQVNAWGGPGFGDSIAGLFLLALLHLLLRARLTRKVPDKQDGPRTNSV